MRRSESQETVWPRSSGESLKWVPKVQDERIAVESLRQKDRVAEIRRFSVYFIFYPGATDTVGDFFILQKRKEKEKWIRSKIF